MLLTIGESVTSSYSERVTALSTRIGGVRGTADTEAELPRVCSPNTKAEHNLLLTLQHRYR